MMILIVAVQTISELVNSLGFTRSGKSSTRREKEILLYRTTKCYVSSKPSASFCLFAIFCCNRFVQIAFFSSENICKQLHVLFLYQFKPQRDNPLVIFMAHAGRQPALLVSVPSPDQTASALQLYAC